MSETVLVTGATGFIGRSLVRRLNQTKWEIVTSSRSSMPGGHHIAADLRHTEEALRLIDQTRPKTVVHLAGSTRGGLSELLANNVATTANLLEALIVEKCPAYIVVMGSAAEYGDPSDTVVDVATKTFPQSDYGIAKNLQTTLTLAASRIHHLSAIVVRPFNIVSPDLPSTYALGNIKQQLLSQEGHARVVLAGRLDIWRDYIPVELLIDALVALLSEKNPTGILNVCSGVAICLEDVLNSLANRLEVQARISFDQDLSALASPRRIVGDPSGLETLVGRKIKPTPDRLAQLLLGEGPKADWRNWCEPVAS